MGRKRLLQGLRVKDGFMRHPFDAQHHVQTSGLVRGPHLATGHPHDKHTTAYYGIAPSVVERMCALWRQTVVAAPPEDYSFIDIGAGMGRAMLVASRMSFREVVGVELHPDLAEIAEKNIEKWQSKRLARSPMRVVCQDAATFEFPSGPCVAYLFNPFGKLLLRKLLEHLETQFAIRPGKLDLIYANDEWQEVLIANPRWKLLWRGLAPLSEEDAEADKQILNHQPEGEYTWSTEEPCSIFRWVGDSTRQP